MRSSQSPKENVLLLVSLFKSAWQILHLAFQGLVEYRQTGVSVVLETTEVVKDVFC